MEHVFVADTNLFFECKRLEELPWSDLAADPIVIALTKPVMAEIDKHKKGSGRTRKRAIEISGRIRGMLTSPPPEVIIQDAGPRVVLRLMSIVQPDPDLAGSLDYTINDDRIVGTVATISKDETFTSVSMLTDDSVAASTAHGLGIPFVLIPENWKRPPEETTEAKQIKELQKDIATYRAQEPSIRIKDVSTDTEQAHVVRRVALALEPSKIDQLIDKLKERHPIQQDFTAPAPETRDDGEEISYEAPDAEAIKRYTSEAYPKWIDACRAVFEKLHEGLIAQEDEVELIYSVANSGTRPATNMRVSFEAKGNIYIRRRPDDTENAEDQEIASIVSRSPQPPNLPAPPPAPAVRRIVKRPPTALDGVDVATLKELEEGVRLQSLAEDLHRSLGFGSHLATIRSVQPMIDQLRGNGALGEVARIMGEQNRLLRPFSEPGAVVSPRYLDPFPVNIPRKHNPEGFYYDQWPESVPVKHGALTCDLFRHRGEEEIFEVEVLFPKDDAVTGAVKCIVEAENLTKPEELLLPVSRTIETYDLGTVAEQMIERCGV